MINLVEEAKKMQDFCDENGWKFCFIGGLALQTWGEPRVTEDVDLTLLTGFGSEESYIETLLETYTGRLPDAAQFALRNRVLLLQSENGVEFDISLGAFPFEESAVERSTFQEYLPDVFLRICSAEDLIVLKAFADRMRDWADIESVIVRQQKLDWHYIIEQLAPLVELKYAPEIIAKLQKLHQSL
ncbi:MAG TPA: nucleotidyl transferase AbiEii/AbiGii toxin family protein [Pyrinomonadaceae bacterium]|nr:nucleotidyl transferase AbiEii/AbiGii toxin family protein [Pyrinomonadaceae bacterium]